MIYCVWFISIVWPDIALGFIYGLALFILYRSIVDTVLTSVENPTNYDEINFTDDNNQGLFR